MSAWHPTTPSIPELTCVVHDRDGQELGYLVIDTTVGGRACGGLRATATLNRQEVAALANTMTHKFAFAGIPLGGAKAGLIMSEETPPAERSRRLRRFARCLAPLLRSQAYIPGGDLGTSHEDVLFILREGGRPPRNPEHGRTAGTYTAWGVFTAVEAVAEHLELALSHSRVVMDGFGKVGGVLAELLVRAGARVVAIATREGGLYHPAGLAVEELVKLRDQYGSALIRHYRNAERLPLDQVLLQEAEIVIPCAGAWVIHEGNAAQLRARAIVPAANIPITAGGLAILRQRGILSLPDYVANCGGIQGNALESQGISHAEIQRILHDELKQKVAKLLRISAEQHRPVWEVAEACVQTNLARMRERFKDHNGFKTKWQRLFERGVMGVPGKVARRWYRSHWLGWPLMRPLATAHLVEQWRSFEPVTQP